MHPWDDRLPLYRQLANRLAGGLLDGDPPEGEAMPSVRVLAAQLPAQSDHRRPRVAGIERGRPARQSARPGSFVHAGRPPTRCRPRARALLARRVAATEQRLRRLGIGAMNSTGSDADGRNRSEPALISAKACRCATAPSSRWTTSASRFRKGRVVGLLGHNGAGKTSLMKAIVGLSPAEGSLSVLGLDPQRDRVQMLESPCYIPDVAVLPRWARVDQLVTLMTGLHPRFSAERARALLRAPASACATR